MYIFGAKATAAGFYKALSLLEPDKKIKAFLVSKSEGNVSEIWGVPVRVLSDVAEELSIDEKERVLVYAAVPELIHAEIRGLLESHGFKNIVMLDSKMEADLMGRYFEAGGRFKSVHELGDEMSDGEADSSRQDNVTDRIEQSGDPILNLTIYAASFYKDKPLNNPPVLPSYYKKLFLGCAGAEAAGLDVAGQADFYDNIGDNISSLNPNRCEMTAHYWVWKNTLDGVTDDSSDDYVGICHYRRTLDLSDDDLRKIKANDVDVVLPYPMIHYPDAAIQHTWYVPEKDWELMRRVVEELQPEYGEVFDKVFSAPEFYNYNMMLAKKSVFSDYCAWLYQILDRIEELSEPKGADRHDRYTAYLSESLETLYFMANLRNLKIYHTGRLLYT